MRKITQEQLEKLRKVIVSETVKTLHSMCPGTLSGRHNWKPVRKNFVSPAQYYQAKRCSRCKMWND